MEKESTLSGGRHLRSDQVSGLMLLALALYVAWMNRAYPTGSLAEPGPGYVPLLLAIFLGVMGLLVALSGSKSIPLAALEWTEALTLVSETHAPDAVYDEVKKHFSEKEIVDLTIVVSTINMWNRLAISMRAVPGHYRPANSAATP